MVSQGAKIFKMASEEGNLTNEMSIELFSRWKVDQLKTFLKKRVVVLSGRKYELAEKAYFAWKLKLEVAKTTRDHTGLRLNDKKTEALWIGACIGNDKILLSGKEFKWPKDKVKSLGLWISTDPELSASLNYNEKLEKVKEILRCWKYRRLTLLGKITVIKSLVVSQLVYLLSPLGSNYTGF